jgi:C-terminal processing protease CtpA/Prc
VTTPFRAYPEIAEVTPDSPAAKAGIKAGDVILAIDDVSITSAAGSTLFRDVKANQKVKILLIRNAEVITVTLTAAAPR